MLFITSSEMGDEILFVLALVVVFFVQITLCIKANNIFVRLLPAILSLISTTVLFIFVYTVTGWDAVGYLLLAILSGSFFVDCIAALIVGGIVRLLGRSR